MKAMLGALLIVSALLQSAAAAPGVTVTDAWMRALPGGLPAGGYFTLHNPTAKTLTLQSASSQACGMLMLHKSDTMSGMATMANVDSIDVKPGGTLDFSPGGYHLMCMKPALKRGDKVSVTLHFAGGSKVQAYFVVRGANGR
jgi:periplasmic copper chaperone A